MRRTRHRPAVDDGRRERPSDQLGFATTDSARPASGREPGRAHHQIVGPLGEHEPRVGKARASSASRSSGAARDSASHSRTFARFSGTGWIPRHASESPRHTCSARPKRLPDAPQLAVRSEPLGRQSLTGFGDLLGRGQTTSGHRLHVRREIPSPRSSLGFHGCSDCGSSPFPRP